jgi:sporulation protein YlmC with PRC-barrel domain
MKLSRLDLREVVTEDGRRLGRVFDFRMHRGTGEKTLPDTIDSLVYGSLGLLERLGVRRARVRTLPWTDVVRVSAETIVVRSRHAPSR